MHDFKLDVDVDRALAVGRDVIRAKPHQCQRVEDAMRCRDDMLLRDQSSAAEEADGWRLEAQGCEPRVATAWCVDSTASEIKFSE